jgi:hypothetical protein
VDGAVVGVQLTDAVDVDAGTGADRAGSDDVDAGPRGPPDAPERGGIAVAQHRARSAREHGGHAVPVCAQAPMADGVDAAVDAMPATGPRSMLNRARREPERDELPMRHDSMLPLGKPGNDSIEGAVRGTWADLGRYVRPNSAHVLIGWMVDAQSARMALALLRKCAAGCPGSRGKGAARPPAVSRGSAPPGLLRFRVAGRRPASYGAGGARGGERLREALNRASLFRRCRYAVPSHPTHRGEAHRSA